MSLLAKGTGLLTAITASLCCIMPAVSLLAGIGGIAATFSWLEPIRPYLIFLTIGVLGFAWYQNLKSKSSAKQDCACETGLPTGKTGRPPFLQSGFFLSILTVFAGLMLAFPHYSYMFYPKNSPKSAVGISVSTIQQANLKVEGMTCAGCEAHLKHAISELVGVMEANASFAKGNVIVKFDGTITSQAAIIEAVNATRYQVKSE